MLINQVSKKKLNYYKSLGINTNSKYFRTHYRRGRLKNIDEEFIADVQSYFKANFKQEICPITHIAYANVTGDKNIKIMPQYLFRKEFLRVFNDNPLTDIYRDKALYDQVFSTENQAYNVIKRVRGRYYDHDNNPITIEKALSILKRDSIEYIIKPSDTNNGEGIRKLIVDNDKFIINNREIDSEYLEQNYGYNFVVQRLIKQHETMAYLHPASVNTLRMVTFRWNNKVRNLYTFARFGHSNDIKDNAGAGGVVVGVKDNGEFMDYGVQRSKYIDKHPTTNHEISALQSVPNYEAAKQFVRDLHKQVLHHNYIAWDIVINEDKKPIFLEANFFGGSWVNQLALKAPMFGNITADVLRAIADDRKNVNDLNVDSLAKKTRIRLRNIRKKYRNKNKEFKQTKRELYKAKNYVQKIETEKNQLKKRIKEIETSRSWRYTKIFRRK